MKKLFSKAEEFFFKPASARPMAALRIGVALVLLCQAFLVRSELVELFGRDGIVQGALAGYFSHAHAPRLSWFVELFSVYGFNETSVIYAFGALYVGSLVFLAAGLFTRTAAIAAWFLHWMFTNTGAATLYGVDGFAHIFLFYFIWMPVGSAYSVDCLIGHRSSDPNWQSRLGLRVLQIHLCIVYLASGIEKSMGPQWWNGELLWMAFSLPVYHVFDMSWLAYWPWLSKLGGWGTLAVELGYPIFIWPKQTRRLWVAATVSLHIGIAIFLGLGVFGCIMAVMTLTVFGFSAEPEIGGKKSYTEAKSAVSWQPFPAG